jgi:hypothetical protein
MTPAERARLDADLAEAIQRWDSLEYRWQRAKHTSSGGSDTTEDLDVEMLRVNATILELKARLASAGTPAPAERAGVDLGAPPANDAPALPLPEFLTAREASELLRMSTDTLERLRANGGGPPWKRIGRRVLYPVAGLREYGSRK